MHRSENTLFLYRFKNQVDSFIMYCYTLYAVLPFPSEEKMNTYTQDLKCGFSYASRTEKYSISYPVRQNHTLNSNEKSVAVTMPSNTLDDITLKFHLHGSNLTDNWNIVTSES